MTMPKAPKKFKPVVGARPAHQQQQQQQQRQHHQSVKTQKPKQPQAASNKQPRSTTRTTSAAGWQCASVIDQQSAEVLQRLLQAAETRRGGATIKSLTLAPHIVHKKPTFAVTCETLKHLPLLKQLVADAGVLEQHQQQVRAPAAPAAAGAVTAASLAPPAAAHELKDAHIVLPGRAARVCGLTAPRFPCSCVPSCS